MLEKRGVVRHAHGFRSNDIMKGFFFCLFVHVDVRITPISVGLRACVNNKQTHLAKVNKIYSCGLYLCSRRGSADGGRRDIEPGTYQRSFIFIYCLKSQFMKR